MEVVVLIGHTASGSIHTVQPYSASFLQAYAVDADKGWPVLPRPCSIAKLERGG